MSKVTIQMSTHELFLRRYHSTLRKMRRLATSLDITIHDFDSAEPSDVCILSTNDCEIDEHKLRCSSSNNGYFISQKDYEEHMEEFHQINDQ